MSDQPTTTDGKDQSSETFYKLRDEEIRALCDKSLTHGAARLFVLISKLVWFPNYGGMFKGMIGTLKCSVADLARYMGCNEKSFYRDQSKNRPGWLELLTAGNYLWITKHAISNGEAMNVYHITVVRPRNEQVTFGFESRFHDHPTGENGNGHFFVSDSQGNSELAKTETEGSPKRDLGTGVNGSSALVKTDTGSGSKRRLPVTTSTSDPLAKTDTDNTRLGQSSTGENGNGQLVKTGDLKKSLTRVEKGEQRNGGAHPPNLAVQEAIRQGDKDFAGYCQSLTLRTDANPKGEFRGKLVEELKKQQSRFRISPSDFFKRRIEWLQVQLDGGKAPPLKPGPIRSVKPGPSKKPMPPEQRSKLFAKALSAEPALAR